MAAYLPTMAAFWIGPYLGWTEQIGLLSFVKHGHRVILYTHGEVRNIPPGIEVRQAEEIIDTEIITDLIKQNAFLQLVADLFRWHLQVKTDYIYMDADRFCLKPFSVFSREEIARRGFKIGPTFFRLDQNSKIAKDAIKLYGQKYPILPWLPFKERQLLRWLKVTGRGVSVVKMPWGSTCGHFLMWAEKNINEEVKNIRNLDVVKDNIYLSGSQEEGFKKYIEYIFRSPAEFQIIVSKEHCLSIHSWQWLYNHAPEGLENNPPENSWIGQQAADLGVVPSMAPSLEIRQENLKYFKEHHLAERLEADLKRARTLILERMQEGK